LKNEVGGYRILYSHNCQFGLSQVHDADKTSMGTLSRIFQPWPPSRNPMMKRSAS
jgi:hypothetical protein